MPDDLTNLLAPLLAGAEPVLAPPSAVRARGDRRTRRTRVLVVLASATVIATGTWAATSLRPGSDSATVRFADTPTPVATSVAPQPTPTVTVGAAGELRRDGFRKVEVGMTVPQAETALGKDLVREGDVLGNCYYVRPRDRTLQVLLMVINDIVSRVEVDEGTERTAEGIGLGDTEEQVMAAYPGEVMVKPHPYTGGHYLHVRPDSNGQSYIFETDGRVVTQFRGGYEDAVAQIEGCA